ncbi:ribose ABC transporter substrate-binding protein RbsB [Salinispira pacifica]|uniref:Ribose ABC transport system, periplasmic ribose-binding protein RbsB n=1 Tax=Salinispira pacifica TaxID=1307761 RepID=V5WGE3_9SPIO|nr:ribose ABC transporter substrate-binding protein RbsB [Salinispira pacifica]AHC14907.1 Ribose ABC transport system, periplasmic ribose-binding protein RbsB [Salinispira pacifica]
MKRIFILVVSMLLLISGTAMAEGQGEAADGGIVIGLSVSTLNNPFFVTLRDGAQDAADLLGVELIVVDSQDDPAREASNIQDLIQRGVDALLINPTDSDAVVPSVQRANSEGIPVFTVDRGASSGDVVAHVASDNVAGGEMAGEYLVEAIGGSGSVVELQGIPGTSAARDRGEGFNNIVGANSDVSVVAAQTANFNRTEGLNVFQNILQAQSDIDGVFAHNDEMILGAIQAAEAAGRADDIVFVGFDAVDDAVAAVEDGRLAATVAQRPEEIGSTGLRTAVSYLQGETVEDYIPVALMLVTQ